MQHKNLAADYFERHTQSVECHITSDGRVFHQLGNAMSFAQEHNLQPQTIETYNRGLEIHADFAREKSESITVEVSQELIDENPELVDEGIVVGDKIEISTTEDISEEKINEVFETPAGELALEVFLKNNDVESMKYEDVKKLVKHFNLEHADQKAETLKSVLAEFQKTLK